MTARPLPRCERLARRGRNELQLWLRARPAGLGGAVTVHSLEVSVEYSHFAARPLSSDGGVPPLAAAAPFTSNARL